MTVDRRSRTHVAQKTLVLFVAVAATLGCASNRVESPLADGDAMCAASPLTAEIPCGTAGEQITLPYQDSLLPVTCTHALGSIHVPDASSAVVFDTIRNLKRVDGAFSIFRPQKLADLQQIATLEVVGGEFGIDLGPIGGLASIDGVSKLRELGALTLRRMPALKTLAPFRCLKVIHGDVLIEDNATLAPGEVEAFLARVRIKGKTVTRNNAP
jgi:hypothetical protein